LVLNREAEAVKKQVALLLVSFVLSRSGFFVRGGYRRSEDWDHAYSDLESGLSRIRKEAGVVENSARRDLVGYSARDLCSIFLTHMIKRSGT